MAAGLQGHIQRGARRGFPAVGQSLPLGVELAAAVMVSLPDDAPVLHNDRAYHGIGVCPAPAPLRQFQRQAHIVHVVHAVPPKKKCLEQTVQGTAVRQRGPRPWKTKSSGMKHIPEQNHGRRNNDPLRSHDLLSSRLYCRPRNFTESCLAARGLYHRWGIAPRPEDPDSIEASIRRRCRVINPFF